MKARARWFLCAGCALVFGLEAPAALAVLRGPAARSIPEAPGTPAVPLTLDARVPEPLGDALDRRCLRSRAPE